MCILYRVEVTEIVETDSKLATWLESIDYVSNFIDSVPLERYQMENPNIKLKLNVGKKNKGKLMLYWGAESSKKILINDALKAYGNFTNYGVTRVRNNGDVILYFNCPQPYSTIEKGQTKRETFYRHMHLCFSNKAMTNWLSTVYTKIVVCNMKTPEMLKLHRNGEIVLINTLPASYYAKRHIPNSYNLHYREIDEMSREELINWMAEVVGYHYPKLNRLLKAGKLSIYELPICSFTAQIKNVIYQRRQPLPSIIKVLST